MRSQVLRILATSGTVIGSSIDVLLDFSMFVAICVSLDYRRLSWRFWYAQSDHSGTRRWRSCFRATKRPDFTSW